MSNKIYDLLKWICLIVLPASATFYTALAPVWNLPYSQEIPVTITAIDAFLGAILGVSTLEYHKTEDMIKHVDTGDHE